MVEKFGNSARFVLQKLNENGFEAYFIGGGVRDALMGLPLGDIDITTSAEPREVEKIFSDFRVIETGIKHGTVTVIVEGTPVEITTFRCESGYSDNRHPDKVEFSKSFAEDVFRRDFTMNGIGLSLDGKLYDEVGGTEDIKNGVIRAIGDPAERFKEDALRILRAVRFSSVLGFTVEDGTKKAIHEQKELLKNISAERIRAEFLKLICGKNAESVMLEYADVIGVCIPELQAEMGFLQHNRHHIFDVYTHSVKAMVSSKPEPLMRMALLLHDLGKPETAKYDENGEMHFKNHPEKSAEISERVLSNLRFSNDEKDRILAFVRFHGIKLLKKGEDGKPEYDEQKIKYALSMFGIERLLEIIEVKRCDNTAKKPEYFLGNEFFEGLKAFAQEIYEQGDCWSVSDLKIGGNDLSDLGIEGREIGETLKTMLRKVLDGELTNTRENLIDFAKQKRTVK